MKILIVSQYFWPETFRTNDFVTGLKENGHEVTVLTGRPNYPSGKIFPGYGNIFKIKDEYKGVTILRVPIAPRGNGKNINLIMNYFSFVATGVMAGPFLLKKVKFDLIFAIGLSPITAALPAVFLSRRRNVPLILWIQDLWPESISATGAITSEKIIDKINKMVKFIYKNCKCILIQSESFKDLLMRNGVQENKIAYLPNSAEEIFTKLCVVDEGVKSLIPRGFVVMFAGNIGVAQDFETILEAANKLSDYADIHFVIVGGGRIFDQIKDRVHKMNLQTNVHLLGQYPVEKMKDFFSCANVMLVTLRKTYIFSLTIPSKVQSYMACGRPIIAALDGEGARIIEESESGFRCASGDSQELANIIIEAYKMPRQELENMGKKGREYYEKNFERQKLLKNFEELVRNKIFDGENGKSI